MKIHRILLSLVLSISLPLVVCIGAGEALSSPASRPIGEAPADLHALPVAIKVSTDDLVSGWLLPGVKGNGAVLLLHGVRSDRRQMIERARLLNRQGYAVLLIDLPAHGESTGKRITFGLREATGVKAALGYLRQELPEERIGVIGVSLGAASFMLSKAVPAPNAVVLESMFPTITEAVTDRLTRQLGPAGDVLAPLLLWQLPFRLGISASDLRPIDEMPSLRAPVLIMSGTRDEHTTLAESKRIFEAAHGPKEFWPVEGAAHVDLYMYSPKAYESKLLPFLAKYLPRGV